MELSLNKELCKFVYFNVNIYQYIYLYNNYLKKITKIIDKNNLFFQINIDYLS